MITIVLIAGLEWKKVNRMDDLISRQAAIKAICERECDALKPCEAECESIWAVEELPIIDPQPKWIPVSERLPENGEYVLCSQENGDVGEGKLLDGGSWLICYDQTCRGSYWVNAWMPLPDPWKGGE